MMCSDANDVASWQAIHATLKWAFSKFDLDVKDVDDTLSWITDMSSTKAPNLGLPFAVAFLEAKDEGFLPEKIEIHGEALLQTINDDRVHTVFEAKKIVALKEPLEEKGRLVQGVLNELRDEPTLGYSL